MDKIGGENREPIVIKNKYRIDSIIGNGAFGTVFIGQNIKTQEKIAIKTESNVLYQNTLKHEAKMIQFLYMKGVRKITDIYWYGTYNESIYMIMPLYDRSLADCIPRIQSKTWEEKLRTITGIMRQVLDILIHIHKYYVIHRDIKPQNFMLKGNSIYLIDFGLATFYLDSDSKHYEAKTDSTTIIGSPKYASIHLHKGFSPSRRDDIISLCYLAIYLELGYVKWDTENIEESSYVYADINQIRMKKKENILSYTKNQVLKQFLYDNIKIGFYETPIYDYYADG